MKTNLYISLQKLCFLQLSLVVAFLPYNMHSQSAVNDVIHHIENPCVKYNDDYVYDFIVMGDTRNANPDPDSWESKHAVGWKHIRNDAFYDMRALLNEDASFVMFTGDLPWIGSESEYWDEIRKNIPSGYRNPESPQFFPVLGNHELWQQTGEPDPMQNFSNTFPYLAGSDVYHNYYFKIGNSLFFNLCSGGYDNAKHDFTHDDTTWNCKQHTYEEVMQAMGMIYGENTYRGRVINNIFIQYHKPSYSCDKHPPLYAGNDPLTELLKYKKDNPDLKIFVFNGHNHTTELYNPEDGVYVLVAGGGGAPQKVTTKTWHKQEEEIFWKNLKEPSGKYKRANYFRVFVDVDEDVEIQEMCLYLNEEVSEIYFGKGLMIDHTGTICDKISRYAEVDIDRIIEMYERNYSLNNP